MRRLGGIGCFALVLAGIAHASDVAISASTVKLNLTAKTDTLPIFSGAETNVWRYEISPKVTGAAKSVFPIVYVKQGQVLDVNFKNSLPQPTSVHWHGFDIPASMDGHPADAIRAGGSFRYRFPVLNRASTLWFHPHPDQMTASQVAQGLAGVIVVSDPEEQALTLPRGKRDQVLVIQDRATDANNQFVYSLQAIPGFMGNKVLVNGVWNASMNVQTAVYRLRLLNGSNARIYKLAWSNGMPMTVIGTDQGLLSAPVTRNYVMLSPGERIEVWADFRSLSVSSNIKLISQSFTPGGPTGGGSGLAQGASFDVMTMNVTSSVTDTITLPSTLSAGVPSYTLAGATNFANPRLVPFGFASAKFTLNGGTFNMSTVAANELPKLGEEQIWEFQNIGISTLMPHPIHLHSSGFRVLERVESGTQTTQVNSMKDGLLDEGFKDTFLIFPGEKVKIVMKPLFYTGRFLYHCHNLEHEDQGMMRNFDVVP